MSASRTPPAPGAVAAALHAAMWAMRTQNAKALVESGITGTQAGVLWFLHEYKALSLGRLAALQVTTPANMTGVVRRLEREGLVRRRAHPSDSRVKMIELTPEGEARTKQARKAIDRAMAQLFEDASTDDLAAMLRVLTQVRDRAERSNPPREATARA